MIRAAGRLAGAWLAFLALEWVLPRLGGRTGSAGPNQAPPPGSTPGLPTS